MKKKILIIITCCALIGTVLFLYKSERSSSLSIHISQEKININTSTKKELMTLPSIGEALADRIIENRPYSDICLLADIEGIGYKTFSNIKNEIEVGDES